MKQLILCVIAVALSSGLFAQDRQFAWTYQSNVLPVGSRDLEVWNTYSAGRNEFYHALAQRLEFEAGVAKNLQTALYLNVTQKYFQDAENGNKLTRSTAFSVSNEWKYRLLNPSVNVVGMALYGEVLLSPDEFELETKLILDKRIGHHLFAFNAILENEYEYHNEAGNVEAEWEMPVEFDFGYMYNFNMNIGLGIEARNHNIIEDGDWESSALFAGPSLFVASKGFYAIFNILPQLRDLRSTGGSNLSLDDHERMMARLFFGINI